MKPESIQSSTPSAHDYTCNNDDDQLPLGPRCEPESSTTQHEMECEEPPGLSQALVTEYMAKSSVGNNNAERVAQTPIELGHAETGTTANGSSFASAALLYGKMGDLSLEVASCSVQAGAQTEAQCALFRVTRQDPAGGSETSEVLSAKLGTGTHNKDGSVGANVSAGAALYGFETTTSIGAGSATLGVSAGPAIDVSYGVRDSDGDGALERCLRAGAVAVGGDCVEELSGWRR
jgi:hypothetical protein